MVAYLQDRIRQMLDAGHSLDTIDSEVIEPAPLSRDQKSALWLYAWARGSSPHAELPLAAVG